MTSKKLRDVHVSEQFADGSSLVAALDSIDCKLESMQTADVQTLADIAKLLNSIIAKFGGKPLVQQVFEVDIADVAGKRSLFLCNNINPFGSRIVVEFERI